MCGERIVVSGTRESCVKYLPTDDSGRWGKGGLFSAISGRSPQPQAQYELAGKMRGDDTLYILANGMWGWYCAKNLQEMARVTQSYTYVFSV